MRRIPFRPNNQIALINMISRTVLLFYFAPGRRSFLTCPGLLICHPFRVKNDYIQQFSIVFKPFDQMSF